MQIGAELAEVMERSGLTRRQLRYIEERGFLGVVRQVNRRRRYSPEQTEMLVRLARLLEVDAHLEEAAAIANYGLSVIAAVSDERLEELTLRALSRSEQNARLAAALGRQLLARRSASQQKVRRAHAQLAS